MSDAVQEIEDFFGVYLLVSKSPNPKFAGKTYIGYTVDPNRRIKQHNGGKDAGGAKRTSNRGPWMMVLIVHGFPNNISALRFEWAWQQPNASRRLKLIPELQKKQRKETNFGYSILTEMLRIGPWNRLPLTVRWLLDDFHREFQIGKTPPLHMPISFGRVKKVPKKRKKHPTDLGTQPCNVTETMPTKKIVINYDFDEYDMLVMNGRGGCDATEPLSEKDGPSESDALNTIDDDLAYGVKLTVADCTLFSKRIVVNDGEDFLVRCIQSRCKLVCHIECLAGRLLEPGQYVPIEGDCPICDSHFLWGDVIRKANGCNDLVDDLNCTEALEMDDVSDEDENLGNM